jgi:hypothetical protein
MTADNDFFRLDQCEWFQEFVDHELSKIPQDTNPHPQKFEFDDVPF